jgi:hypothetical protein
LKTTSNGISVIDIALSDSPVFQKNFSIRNAAAIFPGNNAMNAVHQRNGPVAFANGQMHIDTSPVSCTHTKRIVHRLDMLDTLPALFARVTVLITDH